MDSFYLTSGLSLSNIILGLVSLGWLFYRVRKVVETPVDDLVKLLGLEVPVAPIATLVEVTAASVALQWKINEPRNAAIKYVVKLNGTLVGEVQNHENAVNIANLKPGHFYIIRIIAVNAAGFQASSELIRVRTSEDRLSSTDNAAEQTNEEEPTPVVLPYKASSDSHPHSGTTQVVSREHSGSVSLPKRSNLLHRRPSPVIMSDSTTPSLDHSAAQLDSVETVPDLTAKLDVIRRDIDELEHQDDDDEKQYEVMQITLVERREQLRQQLRERDDESNELKRNVTSLERQTTAVQTRRTKQEKLLSQRKSERERFFGETSRWERETSDFQNEMQKFVMEKERVLISTHGHLQAIRQDQEGDMQSLKTLEERLVEARKDIKDLEEEQEALDEGPGEAFLFERQNRAKQEEMDWNNRIAVLQDRYSSALAACNQAQYSLTQFQHRLDYGLNRHNTQQNHFLSQLTDTPINPTNEALGAHIITGSRSSVALDHHRMPSLAGRNAPGSLVFQSPSPFFNSTNPISAPARSPIDEGMTEAEADMLTGGALASPSAGALLPSGLLGDDLEETQPDVNTSDIPYLPGLGEDPGPQSPEVDDARGEITSPLSPDSHSPSVISSPHGSVSNFHQHQYKTSESRMDSDRRSIRSTSSSTRAAPARRFVDYLGLQRARATSNEGLPLGSLKHQESQSLPRSEANAGEHSSRAAAQGKRGGLFGSMSQAFNKMGSTSSKVLEESEESSTAAPTRNAAMGLFGLKGNNIWAARSTASRPASTYSNYSMENALPRPSGDTQPFGWPANDTLEPQTVTRHGSISYPWSSLPSRRQSVQPKLDESSNSMSALGSEENDSPITKASSPQAPIGTRPSRLKRELTPKQLNPNARDFMSMLTRDKNRDRSKKVEASSPPDEDEHSPVPDSSYPESRHSKEARLSSAAESTDEVSEEAFGSPAKSAEGAKESFMKKMTRKGSSGKFSLSTSLKEKGGSLFSRKGASSEDVEEEGSASALARSLDSSGSGSQGTNDKKGILSSFKRRKRGTETPSISEASMASETGDEADERPSVDLSEG